MKGSTDILNDGDDALREMFPVECVEHFSHFGFPVSRSQGLVDALVSEDGQLTVLVRDIDQYAIAVFRLFHLQGEENLTRTVNRVNVFAFRLYEDPDLTACLFFLCAYGIHNTCLIGIGKEAFMAAVERKQSQVAIYLPNSTVGALSEPGSAAK